nr:AraC family transcriptional regulator [Pseudomaricurvus alkylphenolicus]
MPDSHLVSTAPIRHIARLVEQLGGDIDPLCQLVGLERNVIEDMQVRIPYPALVKLMEAAAQQCQRPDFSLLLANMQHPYNMGPLGLLANSGENLNETLDYLTRYYHLHNQSVKLLLQRGETYSQLIREDLWLEKLPTFQYCTLTFAHYYLNMRYALGEDYKPAFVTFTYSAPVNRGDYEDYFQCPVEFEQPINAFGFHSYTLDIKLTRASTQEKKYLHDLVHRLAKSTELTVVQNVKLLTRHLLHSDNCSQEYIAQLLQIHPKKLQRALKDSGTTFREIRADSRLALAEHFLKDSDIPLTVISEMLDFSELSALSRAFKSKHQLTPREWRERHKPAFIDGL